MSKRVVRDISGNPVGFVTIGFEPHSPVVRLHTRETGPGGTVIGVMKLLLQRDGSLRSLSGAQFIRTLDAFTET